MYFVTIFIPDRRNRGDESHEYLFEQCRFDEQSLENELNWLALKMAELIVSNVNMCEVHFNDFEVTVIHNGIINTYGETWCENPIGDRDGSLDWIYENLKIRVDEKVNAKLSEIARKRAEAESLAAEQRMKSNLAKLKQLSKELGFELVPRE